MNATWLQHVPYEGPGSISEWMAHRGIPFPAVALWNNEPLPDPASLDLLVVMGGPMNVDETDAHPWLLAERRFIRDAIDAGVRVLGICLGAQLIARALGAEVRRGPRQEVGWFPIHRIAGATHPLFDDLPDELMAYHWHGDTFDLPDGAIHIAGSQRYPNQAFAWGDHVIALQCHLETTPQSARDIIDNTRFTPGPDIQSADDMLADPARFDALRSVMDAMMERLVT
ncbi:type 1 glutamine amidotransferase [uncultured Abyssibacter sp.]|uniref:type 1 glutamine amidotransferase n=1 Tax=uncultured Abyssibacter sp. TaxID=2320202 RepID=UPI0032B2C313